MTYGSASYRIDMANRLLDLLRCELSAMPDKTDPAALDALAKRIADTREQVLAAADYSRRCHADAAEANARIDALIAASHRAREEREVA